MALCPGLSVSLCLLEDPGRLLIQAQGGMTPRKPRKPCFLLDGAPCLRVGTDKGKRGKGAMCGPGDRGKDHPHTTQGLGPCPQSVAPSLGPQVGQCLRHPVSIWRPHLSPGLRLRADVATQTQQLFGVAAVYRYSVCLECSTRSWQPMKCSL